MTTTPSSTATTLTFFVPPADGSRAYVKVDASHASEPEQNWSRAEHPVVIENLRGKEDSATLDTTGFQLFNRPSRHKGFNSDAEIRAEYYPESIELIKECTGASRVVLFDHSDNISGSPPPSGEVDKPGKRQPVSQTHVDQTPAASVARVHRHLPPEDAEALLKRRFQIINLWRPISHPAVDWPLTLCDFKSVDEENDILPLALIYPDREGETYGVKYNPNQRWTYFRGMTPDEFVLIKCFDSIQDGSVAKFTPHTGFNDPTTPEGAPPANPSS
ncbi:hypothetical protein BD779DRAFT_1506155 [Infundibulicybe gibba]|nr:hypothetical protein BD779DRAFT_1506155 [Infundibulicybe gibba]